MCGVLLVQSRSHLSLNHHRPALDLLSRRGPDFTKYYYVNDNTFVAQSVLHITGTQRFYHEPRVDAFAYNGEIYDYRWHGRYDNDVELAYRAARDRPSRFKHFLGTWAWIYANHNGVTYASDPQGEKSLYYYQDNNLLIVCSDIAPILTYVDCELQDIPYNNKCWTMVQHTPWKNIFRCEPGRLYRNGKPAEVLDSIWDWIQPPVDISLNDAVDEFESVWLQACTLTKPEKTATLSFSGGIDSNLVRHYVPNLNLLAIDIVGKDNIVDRLDCRKIAVSPDQWAQEYQELVTKTKMPAQSWSHVGKWLVAKHASDSIIFTGLGADELFGGYNQYLTIKYSTTNHSEYSQDDHEQLWRRCLDAYHGDPRPATLLMDYWYQVVGVDAPGLDRLGGYWGRETRNPFLLKSIIEFAINLPWDLRVGKQTKPVLKTLFDRCYPGAAVFPKSGFAGHANDSLPWLDVEIVPTGNRYIDWKQIARKTFYEYNQTPATVDALDC